VAVDLTDDEAKFVRQVLTECGAKNFAESLAQFYGARAVARLGEAHIPEALRAELLPVADAVLGRDK
jgi:geranylgeranyl diphosphate synthase type II